MSTFTNRAFTDEEVVLDNHRYVGCTFIRCFLQYSGGPFYIENSVIDEQMIQFHGPALWTVHFLRTFGWTLPAGLEAIEPPVDPHS